MKREEEFTLSHSPFGIDMTTLSKRQAEGGLVICAVRAVWFRREKGTVRACAGTLGGVFGALDGSGEVPRDAGEFALMAQRHPTGTSATCEARWDGRTFWAAPPMGIEMQRAYLELLEPMLAAFPAVPDDYDGWWRFTDAF